MIEPVYFGDPRLPDRFWDKVSPEPNSGCWLWIGGIGGPGYGIFKDPESGKYVNVHRHSFSKLVREPDPTNDVCHSCDVRPCINPGHLFEGTRQDNVDDMVAKGRHRLSPKMQAQKDQTHCQRGHEFTQENTYVYKRMRSCRACRRDNYRVRRSATH